MPSKRWILILPVLLLALTGCGGQAAEAIAPACQVVLEEGPEFTADRYVASPASDGSVSFQLQPQDGYTITGADYPDYTLTTNAAGEGLTLTLHQVRYTETVSLTTEASALTLSYLANGGTRLDGGDAEAPVTLSVTPSHLRPNTSTGAELFAREGYTLYAWNTRADGTGTPVGLGSRTDWQPGLTLYAQWSPWTAADHFTWVPSGDGVEITGYSGVGETVTVPAELDGRPVWSIGADAFAGADCQRVLLPPGLRQVQPDAFRDAGLRELYLFDDLLSVSDYAFSGCGHLTTLHINAVEAPVYSGGYFATFADKFDRLRSLAGQKKLVLFSGSSTRFGYDCALLEQAFPDYAPVNMGVFAYTNATPQLLLILSALEPGDLLLHAPEFDASQRQFCTTDALDASFFALIEGDYDLVTLLDLRSVSRVFTAFTTYCTEKADMTPKSYALSPAGFDEDGAPVSTPSYNQYGDYILYRPNAASEQPVYGLPVDYTAASFPLEGYLTPLNEMYQRFLRRGVTVCFTYAPRNQYALSEESTPEARAALHRYLQENLIVPVISSLEESLYSGVYLYGTDNHLSTEGAAIRTQRVIADLRRQLEREDY